MMAKGKAKAKMEKQRQAVDPSQVVVTDLKRMGLWVGIAVGITFIGALVIEALV